MLRETGNVAISPGHQPAIIPVARLQFPLVIPTAAEGYLESDHFCAQATIFKCSPRFTAYPALAHAKTWGRFLVSMHLEDPQPHA